MKAALLQRIEILVDEELWASIIVWSVPAPVRGSNHRFKYRMALIDRDQCMVRYDNEAGKGDHKHVGEVEIRYVFSTLNQLINDFWTDIEAYRRRR